MWEENTYVSDDNEEKVLYTTTSEPLMPVRLYYQVHNAPLLVKALKKLKCVEFDEKDNNFALAYYKEAKNLNLEVYYQDVPAGLYPITLAEGYIKQGKTLHLDLKSLRRAVQVIDFLAKHIPTTLAEIIHFAHSNKLTVCNSRQTLQKIMALDYDEFFEDSRIHNIIRIGDVDDMALEFARHENPKIIDQRWGAMEAKIREQELANYPDVEKFSVSYDRKEHDTLIKMLTLKAMVKEMIAHEHYNGNVGYASIDTMKQIFSLALDSPDCDIDKEDEQTVVS